MSAPVWTVFRSDNLPAQWWADWDALNDRELQGHPLLSSVMLRELVRHFGGPGLLFVRLDASGEHVMQTILEPAGRGRWTVFTPSQEPIAPIVFRRPLPAPAEECLARLLASVGGGLILELPYQDQPFSMLPEHDTARVHRALLGTTMAVRSAEGFEHYWAGRPRDLRQNLRRYTRRAEQDHGTPQFRTITDAKTIGEAVDRFGLLESSGWKGREGTALHPENAQGRFYRDLLVAHAECGRGRVSEVWFGSQLAASRLIISGPTMHVMLKTTYAEELKRYAPGRVLLQLALQDLLDGPEPRHVEFYTRANEDMLSWATHTRETANATFYRYGFLARIAKWRSRRKRSETPAADADSASAQPNVEATQ